ncbi:MAG TPA: non-ribosomal peptide synthetase, partial [Pseudonocardiaceae bacterium]|nr:non-ribosomal peptide synthetase [Pseudonocardiaceae bacterium]
MECRQPGLRVEYTASDLRIYYDLERFDAEHAGRIGGYLAAALKAIAADPDGDPAAAELVPPAERAALIRSGAARALPDARFHELFAERARANPDAVAVVHGDRSWSYAELDAAANRVANALLADGLVAEEVVALAANRGRHWVAAIIGIFRAGGVYLPVEPDWPPARVELLLRQSGCHRLLDDAALAEIAAGSAGDADPRVPVAAGQLAYVYFTSGSTGLPKGALCEHAGMVNHLYAKIDDFGLDAGAVVVQNAQASFDISLWQAIAPLLVGGRTVIVDRADILDIRRFCETITGATVLQLVPSYLDVLLRHLERHPVGLGTGGLGTGGLGTVHTVSVTGEAISKALVNRFFAQCPGLRLINAYGATEASDDTTHEVMTGPPAEELVPVGRPIHNVTVYVIGPRGELVPPGAPGEIAFSGICVGRGYLNDPQRTAQVFLDDPFRPGERLYRTGDFGRWLPTGHLEFHGRRDEQVKVHGVRIELGEVESRVLEHPGVRAAAVVVAPLPGAGKSLVACYTGDVEPGELAAHLATVLPASAVPARLQPVGSLPLTANGKVDKRALVALATPQEAAAGTVRAPASATERRIAAAWAQALNRPLDSIGAGDNFFDLGGGSLSALRVVAALDGLVSLDELVRNPALSALAAASDGAGAGAGGSAGAVLRR